MQNNGQYIGLSGETIAKYGYKIHLVVDNGLCYKIPGVYTEELNELLGAAKSLCGITDIGSYDKKSLAPLTKLDINKATCMHCLLLHHKRKGIEIRHENSRPY